VFTGFFILFGALKSRSQSGVLSFLVFIVCPFILFYLFRDKTFIPVTNYGVNAYGNSLNSDGFFSLNVDVLDRFFHSFHQLKDANGNLLVYENGSPAMDYSNAAFTVFHSTTGILLMRFIAFAYTYHYLNWFSKTEIIRWHKVPKARFVGVVILWIASLVLYAINYTLGLDWLFFLSFCHVLLEFPLNVISVTGIGKELVRISKNGFKPSVAAVKK
jgi:hypothetical protein